MAVTVSVAVAAVAIRAATSVDSIPDPVALALKFAFPAASELVLNYAPGAPDDIHNAAAIRVLGWLYDADPTDSRVSRAIQVSGAAGLLARWRVHRAGAVGTGEGPEPAPAPSPTPGAGLPPLPASGHFILAVDNGDLVWLAFPKP